MTKKILITDGVHELLRDGLKKLGFEVNYNPTYNPEDLINEIGQYSGIVINSKIKMTSGIIEMANNLEFIARLGSGLEIIDLNAAKSNGIHVFNSPEGNRNAVAEHAIGMLLCLTNNLLKADKEVRSKIWKREENRGIELEGKTVGIIGLGNTGRTFAKKLSSWALDLIYYDPYVLNNPKGMDYISKVSLERLKTSSDIISLHVPLTNETKHMIDESFLSECKTGMIIINTSRGQVLETNALISALENNKLLGACLDVFENEKPHHFTSEEDRLYNKLYACQNVVLSPHIAGWTHESLRKIAEVLMTKISSIY